MTMKNIRGFTIIELMFVILIGATLAVLAVPSFKNFIEKGRVTVATNELVTAFVIARSEAVNQESFTCVCSSATATANPPACNNNNNWEDGWIVFLDNAGDCAYADGIDRLIKATDGADFGNEITIRHKDASVTNVNYVRYNTRGQPQRNGGVIQQGVFSICDRKGLDDLGNGETSARAVQLQASGSVRSTNLAAIVASCP